MIRLLTTMILSRKVRCPFPLFFFVVLLFGSAEYPHPPDSFLRLKKPYRRWSGESTRSRRQNENSASKTRRWTPSNWIKVLLFLFQAGEGYWDRYVSVNPKLVKD